MGAHRSYDGKNWIYIVLAAVVAVALVVTILIVKYRTPPAPEYLKIKATEYFTAISDRKLSSAYDLEKVAGDLPYARYDEAISKHYSFVRGPRFKTINIDSVSISGNDAVVHYRIDVFYEDNQRIEMLEGDLNFHLYPEGWKKEPEEYLSKALEQYRAAVGEDVE